MARLICTCPVCKTINYVDNYSYVPERKSLRVTCLNCKSMFLAIAKDNDVSSLFSKTSLKSVKDTDEKYNMYSMCCSN